MASRILAAVLFVLVAAPSAHAAELVMFWQKGCVWCERFDREIAPAYDKTDEGKRAPLRRVDIGKPMPAGLCADR
jgi:cytochrome c551/c552